MRYSKSTRYALYAVLEMAAKGRPVAVVEIAATHGIPETVLSKVLQGLVRGGIARGVRGVGGGYVLARPAAEISTLDVIAVFDPPRREGHCLLSDVETQCADTTECRLRRLFDEVDEMARCTFESVTLDTLLRTHPARD